ncbi:MAG: hypothetical protein V3S61_03665 [Dehalococcoidales bacterium]
MLELEILEIEKQTLNKLRWDTQIDQVPFEIYIPKWRVPKPWPRKIYVDIQALKTPSVSASRLLEADVRNNPSLAERKIIAYVKSYKEKEHTLRYQPVGDKSTWEIGEPYIPYPLTQNCAQILKITIHWEKPANF